MGKYSDNKFSENIKERSVFVLIEINKDILSLGIQFYNDQCVNHISVCCQLGRLSGYC